MIRKNDRRIDGSGRGSIAEMPGGDANYEELGDFALDVDRPGRHERSKSLSR